MPCEVVLPIWIWKADSGILFILPSLKMRRRPEYTWTTGNLYACFEECGETRDCSSGAYSPSTQEWWLWNAVDPSRSSSSIDNGFFHIGSVDQDGRRMGFPCPFGMPTTAGESVLDV
jgi:hypothetical protein